MTRAMICAATAALSLGVFSSNSHAVTHAGLVMSKRQIVLDCMSRRMAADRTMSYNSASKECTARMKSQPGSPIPSMHAKR